MAECCSVVKEYICLYIVAQFIMAAHCKILFRTKLGKFPSRKAASAAAFESGVKHLTTKLFATVREVYDWCFEASLGRDIRSMSHLKRDAQVSNLLFDLSKNIQPRDTNTYCNKRHWYCLRNDCYVSGLCHRREGWHLGNALGSLVRLKSKRTTMIRVYDDD